MLIRDGFVTNSSSTNFLVICKEDLTEEYLFKKLGFEPASRIADAGYALASGIIHGTGRGLRHHDFDEITPETIKIVFGEDSAAKFIEMTQKGCKAYWGSTSTDDGDDYMTVFMTIDHFLLDEDGFYFNGKNCAY